MVADRISVRKPGKSILAAPQIDVLVLDDSEFDRKRIKRLFRSAESNLNVHEADTLLCFEKLLDVTQYDVIVIDYSLPEGTGIDAVELLRKHPQNGDTVCVMIAGNDQSEVAVQALKMGCADYISKSRLSEERLRETLVASISQRLKPEVGDFVPRGQRDKIAQGIVADLSAVLQPKLARILRDLRVLKRQLNHPDTNVPGGLDNIDKTCVELWKALAQSPDLHVRDPKSKPFH